MNIKSAIDLFVKYVFPVVEKIVKSKISLIAKSLYEKLYDKILKALKSFEKALSDCFLTKDANILKKRIDCCELGLKFFKEIHKVLDEAIPAYEDILIDANEDYKKLTDEEATTEEK